MPPARALISVQEYLASVYQPDCDFADAEEMWSPDSFTVAAP